MSVQVEGQKDHAFKLFYYDADRKENVVREILKYVYTVLEMKRSSDRIRSLKLGDKNSFSVRSRVGCQLCEIVGEVVKLGREW